MVKLYVDDLDQLTMLDVLLDVLEIQYERVMPTTIFGMTAPFLVVDGVPLDFNRSIKWMKGRSVNE